MEIDLKKETLISEVIIGSMENQGSGIYYPVKVEVFVSDEGEDFQSVGLIEREFKENGNPELKDFSISFNKTKARYIKVEVKNLAHPPQGGSAWLFVDEIVVK